MPNFNRIRQLLGMNSGSGMGDVQRADAPYRSLPVMSQGYGSPQNDQVAQTLQDVNTNMAQQGLPAQNVSPQDVDNFNKAMQLGTTISGGLSNPALRPQLSMDPAQAMENYQRVINEQGPAGLSQPSSARMLPEDLEDTVDLSKKQKLSSGGRVRSR